VEFQFKMTVEQMADTNTTLFVARDETGKAVGMGALKVHSPALGEVKRMFTDPEVRGKRIGSALLDAIVGLAREKGLPVLMLETGTGEGMAEAHRLYTRSGFKPRGPFLDYPDSEWSAFYEMPLTAEVSA
jgi:putative acetyltransferase